MNPKRGTGGVKHTGISTRLAHQASSMKLAVSVGERSQDTCIQMK